MKTLLLPFIFSCLPSMALSQDIIWQPWTSDEQSVGTSCANGIEGFRCRGSYCDDISVACAPMAIRPAQSAGSNDLASYSEENGPAPARCSEGSVVTGIKCTGSNCDNITLTCTAVDGSLGNCTAVGYISEEAPANVAEFQGRYLTGIGCNGSFCDNKILHHCEYTPSPGPFVGEPVGRWAIACAGSPSCTLSITERLTYSNSESFSSSSTRESVAVKIEAGVKFKAPDGTETTYSAGLSDINSSSSTDAATAIRANSSSYENECAQEFPDLDVDEKNIAAIWQWEISVPMGSFGFVNYRSCIATCTRGATPPSYPGITDEALRVCRIGFDQRPLPVADPLAATLSFEQPIPNRLLQLNAEGLTREGLINR